MIFTSDQKLTFGKYIGIQVGMVYMLAPSYINWMLLTKDHAIKDLDFLLSLDVMERFGTQGHIAHATEVDVSEFNTFWTPKVMFEDIMYSGYELNCISQDAIEINETILSENGVDVEEGPHPLHNENPEPLIYFPNLRQNSDKTIFTPTGFSKSKKGFTVISFKANNRRRFIDNLPHQETVFLKSFYWDKWNIDMEELERRKELQLPFFGQIKDGYLMLKKEEVDLKKWYKEQHWEYKEPTQPKP